MPQFVHSFVDGYLGCFWFGIIMNESAMNIPVNLKANNAFLSLG
jgi:hypothetical protein